MNNILSATKYRLSPEGVCLMDEANNLASQVAPKNSILYAIWGLDLSHSGRVSGILQQSDLIFALHFIGIFFKTD